MCVWHLPHRSGPFHSYLCCHVQPVSETSLSLEVQTKHCSTCATQTTAELQTCMFMSDFLANSIETAVYARLLYTHDYWMNLERVSRGKGDSSECTRQVFWLGGYKNDSNKSLSTCWVFIINRIYSKVLMEKRNVPHE